MSNNLVNEFESSPKKYLVKVGEPIINNVSDINQLFKTAQIKKKMDYYEKVKKIQKEYREKIEADGGDFHYFKKQSFSEVYKKTVNLFINH
jgi:hypothetical protein